VTLDLELDLQLDLALGLEPAFGWLRPFLAHAHCGAHAARSWRKIARLSVQAGFFLCRNQLVICVFAFLH